MAIIFTFGVNESGVAKVKPDHRGQLNIHVDGVCEVFKKVDLGNIQVLPLLIYGPNAPQPLMNSPVRPTLIFNQISDADSHVTALQRCVDLCRQFAGVPVINHPEAVMNTTRDRVSELLQGIAGVRMPRTIRCAPASPDEVFSILEAEQLKLPVIQRKPGDHNARSMVLIEDLSDLEKLHVFPFDGRDFYLTEFVDYKNGQGIYSTQRITITGGEPTLRHALFSNHWKVNSASRKFMRSHPEIGDPVELASQLEAERLPRADAALREIAKRLKLDYFGIDCHINEAGEVLVFEANANMDILIDAPDALFANRLPGVQEKLIQLILDRSGETLA